MLSSLEAYASAGFINGDAVVVIATKEHLAGLEQLLNKNLNVKKIIQEKRYLALDADVILEQILVGDNIDKSRFENAIKNILMDVKHESGSTIRVYGELVAILWGQGNRKATVELEKLWHEFCNSGVICLFCAYPKRGFRQDAIESIQDICACHSTLVEENVFKSKLNFYGKSIPVPFIVSG